MQRIQVIDLVRCFSILSVMAYHLAISHLAVPPTSYWGKSLWDRIAYNGSLGVAAFFVVSGFLITRILAEGKGGLRHPDLRAFYVRRIGRILPLFLIVVTLGAWMVHFSGMKGSPGFTACFQENRSQFTPAFWASLATFTYNWFVSFHSDHPYVGLQWDLLWTLSIEEQFYLLYPLLLLALPGRASLEKFLFFIMGLGAVLRFINIWFYPNQLSYNSFQNFDMIALGCLLYLVSIRWRGAIGRRPLLAWTLCGIGGVLSALIYLHLPSRPALWWAWWHRQIFCLGIFFFLLGGLHLKAFTSKFIAPLVIPGRLSYGLYLLHIWALYLLWETLQSRTVPWALGILSCGALGLAGLSFRILETPANRWVRGGFMGATKS